MRVRACPCAANLCMPGAQACELYCLNKACFEGLIKDTVAEALELVKQCINSKLKQTPADKEFEQTIMLDADFFEKGADHAGEGSQRSRVGRGHLGLLAALHDHAHGRRLRQRLGGRSEQPLAGWRELLDQRDDAVVGEGRVGHPW